MEINYVIPDMEKAFENLDFGGLGKVEQARINGKTTVITHKFHLFSDVQRAEDMVETKKAENEDGTLFTEAKER